MATKYIVNNAPTQTISGNISISGNLKFTGTTNDIGTYKALLSQTGSITGTSIGDFGNQFIIGETYTVTDYIPNDDFDNIADIQSGGIGGFDYVGAAIGYGASNGVTGTTNGLGIGATFDVYWCGVTYNIINVVNRGFGYVVGDTITILGTDVSGSTPENDITITVTGVTSNATGSVFVATGDTPAYWSDGSELTSDGDIVARVLENSLGFDIDWVWYDAGYYVGYRSDIPFAYANAFPRNDIYTNAESVYPFDYFGCPFSPFLTIGSNYDDYPNDTVFLSVLDFCNEGPNFTDNLLYFTPVEISIKKEFIEVYGGIDAAFPFNYVSSALFCNGSYISNIYAENTSYVNNISEMLTLLNNDPQTKVYDISFSEGGPSGLIMRIPKNIKNLLCNGELQFLVYSDN